MIKREDKVLALVRDEMNMVRSMSLDELDANYEQLMESEYNDFEVKNV